MPPDSGPGAPAAAWLRRARGNLTLARQEKPAEAFWEDLCFDAQQAAEKAVKAVLLQRGIEPPRTHDVGELLAVLRQAGHEVPEGVLAAQTLSTYAVATRYPGLEEPVTEDEWREAVSLAAFVVRWAETIIHGP